MQNKERNEIKENMILKLKKVFLSLGNKSLESLGDYLYKLQNDAKNKKDDNHNIIYMLAQLGYVVVYTECLKELSENAEEDKEV